MKRYVTVSESGPSRSWWAWEELKGTDHLARTVVESERQPKDTGLLDPYGVKLFSVDERQPVGFVNHGVRAK